MCPFKGMPWYNLFAFPFFEPRSLSWPAFAPILAVRGAQFATQPRWLVRKSLHKHGCKCEYVQSGGMKPAFHSFLISLNCLLFLSAKIGWIKYIGTAVGVYYHAVRSHPGLGREQQNKLPLTIIIFSAGTALYGTATWIA